MEENKVASDSSAPNSPELTRLSGEQAEERTAREGREPRMTKHVWVNIAKDNIPGKRICYGCGIDMDRNLNEEECPGYCEFPAEPCTDEVSGGVDGATVASRRRKGLRK